MNYRRLIPPMLVAFVPVLTWAGRPLTVDDAGTVAPGDFEFEAGAACTSDGRTRHYDFPFGLTCGLVRTLEVGLSFGGQVEERESLQNTWTSESGVGDLMIGAKWNPLAEDKFWASHALAFTVKLPTADHHFGSGETDFDLTYIASKSLHDRFSTHLNTGYTWTGDPAGESIDDIVHCGGAIGYLATERIELVAELYSDIPVTDENSASLVFNGGLRWSVCDNLILDAAAGAGLRSDAPDWIATIGLTWTFEIKRQTKAS